MSKSKREKEIITTRTLNVVCITCQKKYQIESTVKKDFKIDVCGNCHPFYLGKQKFESKAGRMERFRNLEKKSILLKKEKKGS